MRWFWFKLAAHLNMSVSQAQTNIDSAEFSEWVALHNIEQFTVNRTENMLAIVATILANSNRKPGATAFEPADFIPTYKANVKDTGKSMEIKLRAILNGNN